MQDTGWTDHLPSGHGLLAFSTIDDVLGGIDNLNHDYAGHSKAAADLARTYFDSGVVLPRLIEQAGR